MLDADEILDTAPHKRTIAPMKVPRHNIATHGHREEQEPSWLHHALDLRRVTPNHGEAITMEERNIIQLRQALRALHT